MEVDSRYTATNPRELAVFVSHAYPCQLSVSILNAQGEIVRRLCHRQSTRPLRIQPEGSTFYWDGMDKTGNVVSPGTYRVRVEGYLGDSSDTVESKPITVTAS